MSNESQVPQIGDVVNGWRWNGSEWEPAYLAESNQPVSDIRQDAQSEPQAEEAQQSGQSNQNSGEPVDKPWDGEDTPNIVEETDQAESVPSDELEIDQAKPSAPDQPEIDPAAQQGVFDADETPTQELASTDIVAEPDPSDFGGAIYGEPVVEQTVFDPIGVDPMGQQSAQAAWQYGAPGQAPTDQGYGTSQAYGQPAVSQPYPQTPADQNYWQQGPGYGSGGYAQEGYGQGVGQQVPQAYGQTGYGSTGYDQGGYWQQQYVGEQQFAGQPGPGGQPPKDGGKKSIFKQWWFYLIIVAVIGGIVAAAILLLGKKDDSGDGDGGESTSPTTTSAPPQTTSTETTSTSTTTSSETTSTSTSTTTRPAGRDLPSAKAQFDQIYGSFESVTQTGSGNAKVSFPSGAKGALVTFSTKGATYGTATPYFADGGLDSAIFVYGADAVKQQRLAGVLSLYKDKRLDYVDIATDGEWEITIAPVSSAQEFGATITGDGSAVGFYTGGAKDLNVSCETTMYFTALSSDSYGYDYRVMSTCFGSGVEKYSMPGGPILLEIVGVDGWSFE